MIVIEPSSEKAKEIAKWEQFSDRGKYQHIFQYDDEAGKPVHVPGNPYKYREFPRMMYLANRRPDGVVSLAESDDSYWLNRQGEPLVGAAESFSRKCQKIVKDEDERRKALELGWRDNPQDAIARYHEKERKIADTTAHRHFEDRNMSEGARAEAEAADAASADHVPEIPEKRRGRKKRVA